MACDMTPGDVSDNVNVLQHFLKAQGLYKPPLKIDSIYGYYTAKAVRIYQKKHGLKVDSQAGCITTRHMNLNCAIHNCDITPAPAAVPTPSEPSKPLILAPPSGSSYTIIFETEEGEYPFEIIELEYHKDLEDHQGGGQLTIPLDHKVYEDISVNDTFILKWGWKNQDILPVMKGYISHVQMKGNHIEISFVDTGASLEQKNFLNYMDRQRSAIINDIIRKAGLNPIYNNGKLNLINSQVSYNNATGNGGGIYANNLVKICKSQIVGNSAAHQGGGIYGSEGKIIVNISQINMNSSRQGGAIYSKFGLKLSDAEIYSNSAENCGGAIYNTSEIEITGSIFRSNGTGKEGSGGAIYNLGTFKTGRDTVFMLNVCGLNGGAIYNKLDSTMIMHNAIFTSNEGFNGGAIYNDGCILMTEASYTGNVARNFAGAIYNGKTGNINFNQRGQYTILFDNNFAYNKGGAIYTQTVVDWKRVEKGRNYPEFLIKG